MIDTFLVVSTSSITMQRLGKIVQRAPAVGAKMWCLSLFLPAGLREAQAAGTKFTQRSIINILPLTEKLRIVSKNG